MPRPSVTFSLGARGYALSAYVRRNFEDLVKYLTDFVLSPTFEESEPGTNFDVTISNTSNTANSDASLNIKVAGTSAGDPYIDFTVTGGSNWSAGVDNAASDAFKICQATGLGSNPFFTLATTGALTLGGTVASDANNTDDLGTTAAGWRDLFLAGDLKNGGTTLATNAQLGYLSGVTSSIQTQLNSKLSEIVATQTISGDHTVTSSDDHVLFLVTASGAARTITLPAAATVGNGFTCYIMKTDASANTVTVEGNLAETVGGNANYVLRLQRSLIRVISDGTNFEVFGLSGHDIPDGYDVLIGRNIGWTGPAMNNNEARPIDFWWDDDKRRLHTRTVLCTEVDDPPELGLRRVGGTYPDTVGSGTLATETLGILHWTGAVSVNSTFQSRSAQIYARAAENITTTAAGGELYLCTTTAGTAAGTTDRVKIDSAGDTTILYHLQMENSKQFKIKNNAGSSYLRVLDLDSGDNLNIGRDDAIGDIALFGQTIVYDDAASPSALLTVGTEIITGTGVRSDTDNTDDLGTSSYDWKDIYFQGSLKSGATTLATAAEVGYLSGVTSALQTQLNAKASTSLSNLASVAINTSLVSDANNTDDLGTSSVAWKDLFLTGAIKNGSSTCIAVSTAGEVTQPLQPSFLAYNSSTDAAATGTGTQATVDFDTEVYDQGSDFASDTFTAPVAGRYLLSTSVYLEGLSQANHSSMRIRIITSNRVYVAQTGDIPTSLTATSMQQNVIADMDAGDTAYVEITVEGSSASVNIVGSGDPFTFFSGSLIN